MNRQGEQQRNRGGRGGPGGDEAGGSGRRRGGNAPGGRGFAEQKRLLIETGLLIALIEESGHGYALIDRVQQFVGDQVYVDPGSVYRILRLLEDAGMITSRWETGVAGPQRRTYSVEPAGHELLHSRARVLAERGNALLELSRLAEERLA